MHPVFFFFNDTATTEIYTLSLHDALPIYASHGELLVALDGHLAHLDLRDRGAAVRSEEHTSELQSQSNLVCRLLLEKKKQSARSELGGQPLQAPGRSPERETASTGLATRP